MLQSERAVAFGKCRLCLVAKYTWTYQQGLGEKGRGNCPVCQMGFSDGNQVTNPVPRLLVPISLTKELTGHPGRLIPPFSNGGLWLYSTFYNISTQIMIAIIYFS